MEPVTPSEPVDGADEPTNVVGDATGMVRGAFDLAPGTRLGEYEIVKPLGGGGMGEVFAAVHPKIGKRVAIKVLKKELSSAFNVERFTDEATVVNTIGHPNIVDIFSFGEMPDGRCYFVMELLVGETLRERIARGRLGIEEVDAIVRPLTRALEAAHGKGVIHRDLKPDNIFLVGGEQPTVKLLDFGIAKLANADHRIEQTKSGMIVGTPQYIAPEQAKGREIDHRADIYALGGIVFEMLAGHPPFDADNAMELVAKHLMTPPPPISATIPDVPAELDALVLAMLAKDPASRPSLAALRATLEDLPSSAPVAIRRDPTPLPVQPRAATPPPIAPLTPAPESSPTSGAFTAVEPVVTPLTFAPAPELQTEAVHVGRGRAVWIAAGVIVLGVAMILSFVLIKVVRSNPDAVVAVEDAATARLEPDAALPADAPAEPDAGVVAEPLDARVVEPPDASMDVAPPDAGVAKPPPPPPPPPPPIVRPRLVLDVTNAGKTLEVRVGGRRFTGRAHVEVDLAMNQQTVVEIVSEGRFPKKFAVRATPRTPVVIQRHQLALELMEPK